MTNRARSIPPLILATCDTAGDGKHYLNGAYVHAIEEAGGALVIVLPSATRLASVLIKQADALFLTGGDDVHPSRWGQKIAPHYRGTIDATRDALEFTLIKAALRRNIPILGICRGLQILNVYFGGTLYQDIAAEFPGALPHTLRKGAPRHTLVHDVVFAKSSRIAAIIGTIRIPTNSIHHQGIEHLAPRLLASGKTGDGLIEAIEDPSHPFLVGVQWHPEALTAADLRWKRLFGAFISAAANKKRGPVGSLS